jgi:hypothetical protein
MVAVRRKSGEYDERNAKENIDWHVIVVPFAGSAAARE